MRICFISFFTLILVSCSQTDNGTISQRTKKQLIGIAKDYITGQLKDTAKETVDNNGIIKIGNEQTSYTIDPSIIIKGMINDDPDEDAIIPVSFYSGPFLQRTEHLFAMKTNNNFEVKKVLDTLMRVIEIRDRIIYAEISKVAPDSPTYGCSLCKEIVRYRYINNDLVLAE